MQQFFPCLPLSRSVLVALFPEMSQDELWWLVCVVLSLNSTWGGEVVFKGNCNAVQKSCLERLLKDVRRFCSMDCLVEDLVWDEFFRIRSIDYKGDEVRVAQKFSWNNIAPALPREIGRVPLADVCSEGSRHYVLHFDHYLKPPAEWGPIKRPKVCVDDCDWGEVCSGLVESGICSFIDESEVFDTGQGPLLNGLFGVTKEERTAEGVEIFRLIMNLIPLNSLCTPLAGDVNTLPAWSGMSPFFLQPSECLLVSSEDVKCFFYTLSVPECWVKFLAFNKRVPDDVLPSHLQGRVIYLAAKVLPMGFLNSVSLAQNVHRNLVLASHESSLSREVNAPESEHRKDRPFCAGPSIWRVYLDNYDLLEKVKATDMVDVEETVAPGILALRQEYEKWQVPRNVKKSVQRSCKAEMQGAMIDGVAGVAYPRESKLCKYFGMAWQLISQAGATQKQWQVACGGLVYFSMFRQPLLGGLNRVWTHIEEFNQGAKGYRTTPLDCKLEVLRFLGMLPLARLDFRLDMHAEITCSDASSTGGGVRVSSAVTDFGKQVAQGKLRGEIAEHNTGNLILSVGLFDGIGALRVALDILGVQVAGHVSVEKEASARRVVESHYPGVVTLELVESVTEDQVKSWSTQFSQCNLVILGGGPPCQGVSGLNADRKGALRDARSSLFSHVPRVRELLKKHFVWCPVYTLMESVASMDAADRHAMSAGIGTEPISCNAGSLTWCQRPRLYWVDWELDAQFISSKHDSGAPAPVEVKLWAHQDISEVIKKGWIKVDPDHRFPTFTTARPQKKPGRKPAGLRECNQEEIERWQADLHRFPPYQYREQHCLVNKKNVLRIPDLQEREVMMGFPLNYTASCAPKGQRKGDAYNDIRLSLLGNSWSVPVVAWLLGQLLGRLGFISSPSPQEVMDRISPGQADTTQGRLVRLPLNPFQGVDHEPMYALAFKLGNLISIKGEDVMLTTPTTQMVKYHRLRASVSSSLWRWRVVTGWRWTLGREHINSLELRAILTSLRWRIEHRHHLGTRLIHLTDSLVCLHCLSRGRSSSRKLRRTLARINALILASNIQPLWGYIHTDQNPADKPSRWGRRVQTKFRNGSKKAS